LAFRGKAAARLKRADRIGAKAAIFLGEDELARGVVKLRDLDSGSEVELSEPELVERLS
jgi:histidyl-tRNA synthetase